MGGFKEYAQYDGMGLAELVKKREVSPAEVCEEANSNRTRQSRFECRHHDHV